MRAGPVAAHWQPELEVRGHLGARSGFPATWLAGFALGADDDHDDRARQRRVVPHRAPWRWNARQFSRERPPGPSLSTASPC